MCIIAYKPVGEVFTEIELSEMFRFNPDGAGFAVRNPKNGQVIFAKGLMSEQEFLADVVPYNKEKWELVVHCRITSRGVTNEKQTHPFKAGNLQLMSHLNIKGDLYFMNGTISDIIEKPGYNDTMSFIQGMQLDKVRPNQELINTIGDITDSKWLVVNKEGIFFTDDFICKDGKWYSNLYHDGIFSGDYYNDSYWEYYGINDIEFWKEEKLEHYFSPAFIDKIKSEKLYKLADEFIKNYCSKGLCGYCYGDCFLNAESFEVFKLHLGWAIEEIENEGE